MKVFLTIIIDFASKLN